MELADWAVWAAYLFVIGYIGLKFASKGAESTDDFFVAGRKLGWFMAGTSMVATTFSADTPLFVAGMTRTDGIFANWFWWCLAIGQITSVFFFARLWHRTGITTDVELLTLRYPEDGRTKFLRIFRVFYEGLMMNCVTMAAVLLSITKIIKALVPYTNDVLFQVPLLGNVTTDLAILIGMALCPVLFTTLVGLHGVVTAEVIQFGMAMTGSLILTFIVADDLSSTGPGFFANIAASADFKDNLLHIVPDLSELNLFSAAFLINVVIGWWSMAPSNGYFVQRMLASKTEKDSLLALLWFNIAHYVMRPWPWIIVGLASLYYFPGLQDAESAYPLMVNKFMPIGLKGLMVASMFAAFMSTSDTHLNWGSSYLINDFYRPYVKKGVSDGHYIKMAKWVMVCLSAITIVIATRLTGILTTFQFLFTINGGLGMLVILRWYWWRINTWSEISGMVSSLVCTLLLEFAIPQTQGADKYAIRLLINTSVTSAIIIAVTYLTSKAPNSQTLSFYQKMRIGGWGWKRIEKLSGLAPIQGEMLQNFKATLICLAFIYSLLMGLGNLILGHFNTAAILLVCTLVSGYLLGSILKQIRFQDR